MKVLAIIFTQGDIHVIRSEADQFIMMQKKGIEIDIMCHKGTEYEQIFKEAGLRVVGDFPQSKSDKRSIRNIRDLLIHEKYDILHVLRRQAIACGLKAAKGLPVKIIAYRGASGLYWHDPTAYENALNPRIDKVICVCDRIRKDISKQLFFKSDKAITVYKGHNHAWYNDVKKADLSELKIPKDAILVSCIANNRKWKGVPTLLDAFNRLPVDKEIHLLLIGHGMDTPYYINKIARNANHDKIHVLGFIPDALNVISASDITIQPSYKNEGLSRSTLEAMSLGVAPIVTNAGGNPELVQDAKCGIVVPIKNSNKMAEAILKLALDHELREHYSQASIKRIKEDFTIEKTVAETIEVYKKLVDT